MLDPWTILGVPVGVGAKQIHAAWREGVSRWHPDRNGSPDATRRLQELNAAYACLRGGGSGAAESAVANADGWVLSGLSGTTFGERYTSATTVAPDCMRVGLAIPALQWLLDEPMTLAIPCIPGVFTLVTLLRPGRLHDGSRLVFRRAGLSPVGLATDLVVTIRVTLPAMPGVTPAPQLPATADRG